jgi:hypothetical protein
VSAEDPDLGVNKAVTYDFGNPSQVQGLYIINRDTGEIFTNAPLTGKGRREPYVVSVRYKHRVGRVLSFLSSRRNWDSPAGKRGGGKVPNPTKGKTLRSSVNIRTSWV